MELDVFSITPSIVIEYLYCPRFIYFMEVLSISQNEDSRYKVIEGREVHNYKKLTNPDYLRKKINVVKKISDQDLFSDKNNIHGKIDEILFLEDGTASPLDYKFAEYNDIVYDTYKTQLIMYSILIEDNFNVKSSKGYIVYTRSKNKIIEVEYTVEEIERVCQIKKEILDIVFYGVFPEKTKQKNKCIDCCYRNIC